MIDQYPEIDDVISYIHRHIDEPLTLPELASHIAYSPFHFTRIFKARTGLTPHYYIASLRLQRAKELLLQTDLPVRDIGMEIGQQSLGTFTTRFTEKVGLTPGEFRKSVMHVSTQFNMLQTLAEWPASEDDSPLAERKETARIEGTVKAVEPFEGTILIGLFPKPIPEGLPLYGTLLPGLGDFCFPHVKPGVYYLMATSVSWEMQSEEIMLPNTTLRTRTRQPIVVDSATPVSHQQVTLFPPRLEDPPILISLPLLMKKFLSRIPQYSN